MMTKLEELLQDSTQQQSFLFSLQEEVRGLGVQLGDLQGTVCTLQDKMEELQESHSTSDSSDNISTRIPKHVSVSSHSSSQYAFCTKINKSFVGQSESTPLFVQ